MRHRRTTMRARHDERRCAHGTTNDNDHADDNHNTSTDRLTSMLDGFGARFCGAALSTRWSVASRDDDRRSSVRRCRRAVVNDAQRSTFANSRTTCRSVGRSVGSSVSASSRSHCAPLSSLVRGGGGGGGVVRFPARIQSFKEIRQQDTFFVDNTHFIAKLEEAGRQLFFARPQRFGKVCVCVLFLAYASAVGAARRSAAGRAAARAASARATRAAQQSVVVCAAGRSRSLDERPRGSVARRVRCGACAVTTTTTTTTTTTI